MGPDFTQPGLDGDRKLRRSLRNGTGLPGVAPCFLISDYSFQLSAFYFSHRRHSRLWFAIQPGEGRVDSLRDLAVANLDPSWRDCRDLGIMRHQHDSPAFRA